MTEKRKNRMQSKKSPGRRFRRFVKRTLLLILFIGLFHFFNHSSLFEVKKVELNVSPELDQAQIADLFSLNDLIGMNSFWVPYKRITRMIASHPLVSSVEIRSFPTGRVTVNIEAEKPMAVMARPWGYYVIGENGQFIQTIPQHYSIKGFPLRFSPESILFDGESHPRPMPWQEILASSDVNDRDLMMALGYKDLLSLRDDLIEQHGIPAIQYIGYHERYGLMLKCEHKPLILIGYGNDLTLHYTRAMKILTDEEFPFGEDKYVDIRFDEYQCAVDIAKLMDLERGSGTPVDEDIPLMTDSSGG